MRKRVKIIIPAILGLILIGGMIGYKRSVYTPPLLKEGGRSPLELACDFFYFGWHFSRQTWLNRSRDWPAATRQRLLAFWHRPGYPDYAPLREKNLLALARIYRRNSLPGPAGRLYLRAHEKDKGNLWLARRAAEGLLELKEWDKLELVSRDILEYQPGDAAARHWLELARSEGGAGSPDEEKER